MEKPKITKEEWAAFCAKNSDCSYGLIVCLTTLCIWEASCTTKEEANDQIMKLKLGLSGFQAEMAIAYALKYEIPDWLDEMMVEISTKTINKI